MQDHLANHDWIRAILMMAFSGYLLNQIYIKTDMLLKREMGFTEVAVDSEEVKLPSITFCPASLQLTKNRVENITADFKNLPHTEDMLITIEQHISINKYE